ncbi:MAG: NAD(P)/FAD-dependent oxidoreductase, partial [Promethearchaeota archaeon]
MTSSDNHNEIISHYPIIVIGAGLGGLGAACQLALKGKSILILEKHNVPGGFATSFVRGRFEFEGALHELSDIGMEGNRGSLYRFLERLGIVPDHLKFKHVPEFYRCIFYDGYDITMPLGIEQYCDKLIELFPNEQKGIEEFMEMCLAVLDGIEYVASQGGKFNPTDVLKKHPWLPRISGLTLSELYEKFFSDSKLITLISQLWGYIGLPPDRINAYAYIAMLIFYLKWGAAYPIGRSHALTSSLVKAFKKYGGEIRYNALVDRILVENGRVSGVQLENGEIYKCEAVISNVNPICTTMKMLPQQVVPEDYKKKIYAPEIGPSGFSVYIGLNETYKKLGFTAHETFINQGYDMNKAFESFNKIESPKYIVAACYNHIYEEISPSGTTELVLTTLQMGKPWQSIAPDQYHQFKDRVADKMVSMVEET